MLWFSVVFLPQWVIPAGRICLRLTAEEIDMGGMTNALGLGFGYAGIAAWQQQERNRWAQGAGGFDTGANAAGRAIYGVSGEASLWGKPIPITWGTRRISGQLLQIGIQRQETTVQEKPSFSGWGFDQAENPIIGGLAGDGYYAQNNLTWSSKTRFYSTFAYVFGSPGNLTATQILRKLWFNGQLVYDQTQGFLSPEIRFRFYQGDENQTPDSELNRERYTHP